MSDRKSLPILVGGCHRSGTTLLRHILDAHSGIYCGPEIKFLRDFYEDYFEDPLRHLRYAETARAALPEEELLNILGRSFIAVHERAARAAGKRRWADKNPENVVYLKSWQKLLGDAWLFVHVVRNPFDTMASILEHPFPLTIPPNAGRWHRVLQALHGVRPLVSARGAGSVLPRRVRGSGRVAARNRYADDDVAGRRAGARAAQAGRGKEARRGLATRRSRSAGDFRLERWPLARRAAREDVKMIWRETRELWLKVDPENRHGLR